AVSVAAAVGRPAAVSVAAAVGRPAAVSAAAAVGRPAAVSVAAAVGCPVAVSVAAVHSSARLPGAEGHSVAALAVVQYPLWAEHALPDPYPRREPVRSEPAHSGGSAGPRLAEAGDRGS